MNEYDKKWLQEKYPARQFILVSKDRNLRIKCRALGIETEDYLHDKISEEYSTPIVYLTSFSDELTISRAKKTGAYGFIAKTTNTDTVCVTLGPHGAIMYHNQHFYYNSGFEVNVR